MKARASTMAACASRYVVERYAALRQASRRRRSRPATRCARGCGTVYPRRGARPRAAYMARSSAPTPLVDVERTVPHERGDLRRRVEKTNVPPQSCGIGV
jgi:hypothetical protein